MWTRTNGGFSEFSLMCGAREWISVALTAHAKNFENDTAVMYSKKEI
jgi:hypothetical protein